MSVVDARQQVARLKVLLSRLQSRGFHVDPRPGSVAHVLRSLKAESAVPESGAQIQAGFVAAAQPVAFESLREIAALVATHALEDDLVTGAGALADEPHEPASTEIEVVDAEIDLAVFDSEPAPQSDERPRPVGDGDAAMSTPQPDSGLATRTASARAVEAPLADDIPQPRAGVGAIGDDSNLGDDEMTPPRLFPLQTAPDFVSAQPAPPGETAPAGMGVEAPAQGEVAVQAPTQAAGLGVEMVLRTRVGLDVQVAEVVRTTRPLHDESFLALLTASVELEPD